MISANITLKSKSLLQIYKNLGIEDKGKVQWWLGKTTADNLKKYVSFSNGTQQRMTQSTNGGKYVEIQVVYARFQAEGKVMVGKYSRSAWAKKGEPKVVTNKNLTYHSNKIRGSHPFERMKADKANSILNQTANYARRIAK